MINAEDPIAYGYLNLDEKKFYPSQLELVESIGKRGFLRSVFNNHGQVLIAGAYKDFSRCYAIITCKRITGMLK